MARQPRLAIGPLLDLLGNAHRQTHHRARFGFDIHRPPRIGLGRVRRLERRPEFHAPLRLRPQRQVHDLNAAEALACGFAFEHRVDEAEDFRRRTARGLKPRVRQIVAGFMRALHEIAPVDVELRRIGALEAEDRLLLVAHREDGARG